MQWLNEPPAWRDEGGTLTVTTGERTDFWRETHYGFVHDNGHLRYEEASGDFTATIEFRGDYKHLYDQAGLMFRLDERNWIKAGIEFVGHPMLSAVVTRDFSDWSTMPLPASAGWLRLRCSREGTAVRVEWAPADKDGRFNMLRLAYLPPGGSIHVGPMCCSPDRNGFRAEFRSFEVGPLLARGLHD